VVNGAPATPVLPPFRAARAQITAAFGSDDEKYLSSVLDRLRFDPARDRIGCPVLVLHGGADPLVPGLVEMTPRSSARLSRLSWSESRVMSSRRAIMRARTAASRPAASGLKQMTNRSSSAIFTSFTLRFPATSLYRPCLDRAASASAEPERSFSPMM
jgi:hypothetical protein